MRYVSTRGRAPELGFADVLLAGLASDGGLYVPADWPMLPTPAELDAATSYADTAHRVIAPFIGDDIGPDDLARMCAEAYATFRHPAVVPLVQIDHRQWLAELFHGPTLSFKDVALQLVGRLFDHVLGARAEHVTIVGATSGDTGPAAIEGVHGCEHVDIVILYPLGGTSEVQRRQMTTVDAPNVRTVAVEGGALVLRSERGRPQPLIPVGEGVFQLGDSARYRFEPGALVVELPNGRTTRTPRTGA